MRGEVASITFGLAFRLHLSFQKPLRLPNRARSFSSMLCSACTFAGESGRDYRLLSPLGGQSKETAPNVWKALNDANESKQFVVKEPNSDDNADLKWPALQHELEIQNIFKDSPFIRQKVDFVLLSSALIRPKMVLQGFEKTLWTARNRRQLTSDKIKWIMKAVS
jgi:male germ cell-associated kinase